MVKTLRLVSYVFKWELDVILPEYVLADLYEGHLFAE